MLDTENLIGPNYEIVHLGTVREAQLEEGEREVVGSYGAGVDSWWGGIQLMENPDAYWRDLERRMRLLIHCNLGAELPETQWHLENVAMPYFRRFGWELTIIKPRKRSLTDEYGNKLPADQALIFDNVFHYYRHMKAMPTHAQTSCSPTFKIDPLQKASAAILGHNDFDTLIFYEANEGGRITQVRANFFKNANTEMAKARAERRMARLHFPPMVTGRTRSMMETEIKALGYELPIKSRCFFCLHTKPHELVWMEENHPDLLELMMQYEEECLEYRTPLRAAEGKGPIMLLDPKGHKTVRQIHAETKVAAQNHRPQLPFDLEVSGCWKRSVVG